MKHLWQRNNWRSYYEGIECRKGLRVRYEKGIDPTLKHCMAEFVKWIRREFDFPIRVVIYVKSAERIKAVDGEMVWGTFFGPYDRSLEPYIRVAVGDYAARKEERGAYDATSDMLETVSHELSHYYQWLNGLAYSERQASYYSTAIVKEYLEIINEELLPEE